MRGRGGWRRCFSASSWESEIPTATSQLASDHLAEMEVSSRRRGPTARVGGRSVGWGGRANPNS